MEIHIIDLNNLLCVGAYGSRSKDYAVDGIPTGGIYQVLQRVKKINPMDNPNKKIIFVCDHKDNVRKQNYPHYKAQRGKYDGEREKIQRKAVRLQEQVMIDYLKENGFPVIQYPGYEADDIMFNLILNRLYDPNTKIHQGSEQFFLHTSDGDWVGAMGLSPRNIFFECSTNSSKLSDVRTYDQYVSKFNTYPEYAYLDRFYGGDQSDNYKGVSNHVPKPIIDKMVDYMGKQNQFYYGFWNMSYIQNYLTQNYEDMSRPEVTQSVIENLYLSFPFYMEDIAQKPYIDRIDADWSKIAGLTDLLHIKIFKKYYGDPTPFDDKKRTQIEQFKNKYREYGEVFSVYKGLQFEKSARPVFDKTPVISAENLIEISTQVNNQVNRR